MMMTTLNNRVSALFADPLRNVFSELDREFGWNGEWAGGCLLGRCRWAFHAPIDTTEVRVINRTSRRGVLAVPIRT